jgi:hypothetical protein
MPNEERACFTLQGIDNWRHTGASLSPVTALRAKGGTPVLQWLTRYLARETGLVIPWVTKAM